MVFKFKTGGFADHALVLSFGSRCVDRQTWGGHVQTLPRNQAKMLTLLHHEPQLAIYLS